MKGSNVCIWKINREFNGITLLLKQKYFKFIPQLESFNIPEEEKQYIYKWLPINSTNFIEQSIKIREDKIKYLEAIAYIEKPSVTSNRLIIQETGNPLPKDMRVNVCQSHVIFIKREGYIYCIVLGSKSLEGKIRSNLLQSRSKSSKWGEVVFKNIQEFSFDKKFYYWILMNKGNKFKYKNNTLFFEDVQGFKSSTERRTHSYNGEGSNIDEEIPLKSIISTNGNLESLYIKILYNNIIYSFYLDYDGRMSVMFNECSEHATQNPKMIPKVQILLTIYFDIIPFLIQKFNELESIKLTKNEAEYRKQKSIEAIQDMIKENGIDLSEIATLATE